MWLSIKKFLGFDMDAAFYDEIAGVLHEENRKRDFYAHLFVIGFELLMIVLISMRPGGPFLKPRRVAYFLLYLSLLLAGCGTILAHAWADRRGDENCRRYFRTELGFMIFFCFWGVAVTLNDQLGGNGLTVFNYVILVTAILSAVKPWQTSLLFFSSFAVLNVLLPYFPDPNGLDNRFNNFINSFFLFVGASAIAAVLYHNNMRAKRDELIIKRQVIQIEEANQLLSREARIDALTNLQNRNCYKKAVETFSEEGYASFACIYIDVNGLHEINNYLGHDEGDRMLKKAADSLTGYFGIEETFRIGGDEFVVLCGNVGRKEIEERIEGIAAKMEKAGYSLSVGLEWRESDFDIREMILAAETAMQAHKEAYYSSQGGERQRRDLDRRLKQIQSVSKETERFLRVMTSAFNGVYVVNLKTDTLRRIFIPDYFMELLDETRGCFSKALLLYSRRLVEAEYWPLFDQICDYNSLALLMEKDDIPGFTYQKIDGSRLMLRIIKFNGYPGNYKETMWLFSEMK